MPYLFDEFKTCFDLIDEIINSLQDIMLVLEFGEELSMILDPPFDPMRTIGKYW